MIAFVPVKNIATAGDVSRERGLVFAYDGNTWRDYPWGVRQRHDDGGGWTDCDIMAGEPCSSYAAALAALERAGLVLDSGRSAAGLSLRLNTGQGRPVLHYSTNDSDNLVRFVQDVFRGDNKVVLRMVPADELAARVADCKGCELFTDGFRRGLYRCEAKAPRCTRLFIERADERCELGKWKISDVRSSIEAGTNAKKAGKPSETI